MNKIAFLTGGLGNLGPVWQEGLKELGYFVWTMSYPPNDITNYLDCDAIFKKCREQLGIPTLILNNAGIDNPPGSSAKFWGNLERILQVNLIGACNICEIAIPQMIDNGGGLIINVGSIQGNIGADWRNYPEGFEKPVGYNLSKAGLNQLSRSIAVQYGRYNIRAVTLAFGPCEMGKWQENFKTKILNNIPIGRLISKESIKSALRFAIECSELTGQQILIDGGYTVW